MSDAQEKLLRLTLAADDRYRLWLPLDQIAPGIIEAFLLQEDRWFYRHPGVNPLALARGAWRTSAGTGPRQGGSTITMQLARLMYQRNTRSMGGKLRQIGHALALELMYSKREILEAYLNLVPYGANVEGVGAASLIHFSKPTRALSLPEMLTLAVIPQSPARRSLGRTPADAVVDARLRLFERWHARHPEAEPQRGLMSLALNLRAAANLPFLAPHAVNSLLARDGAGGPREIRATLDMRLQRTLERQVRRYVERGRRIGIENATAMLVDSRSMEVKAVVGSADFYNDAIGGQVNGTLAKRSPGSTLKPFIYALAMDQGLAHPLTVLKDAPVAFGPFSPENFDGGFVGPIAARDALVRSRNVPAVRLASQLSAPSLYGFLKSAGVARLAPEKHYGLALALGGGDVTMEELATLYGVLANRGVWRPLRNRVTDPENQGVRLLSEEASYMTLDILRGNPRPEGVMMGARMNVSVAWKTGTSWGFPRCVVRRHIRTLCAGRMGRQLQRRGQSRVRRRAGGGTAVLPDHRRDRGGATRPARTRVPRAAQPHACRSVRSLGRSPQRLLPAAGDDVVHPREIADPCQRCAPRDDDRHAYRPRGLPAVRCALCADSGV